MCKKSKNLLNQIQNTTDSFVKPERLETKIYVKNNFYCLVLHEHAI